MLRLAVLGLLAGAILSAHAQACVHAYGVYAMPACRVFASAPSDALVLVAPVDSHSLPMVRGAWRAYTSALKSQPLRTNVVTSGVITVAGDTMAQLVAHGKRDETAPAGEQKRSAGTEGLSKVEAKGTSRIEGGRGLDLQRSASMLGWGTIVSGGALYYWFRFLDHLFPPHQNTLMRVLAKVGVNQAGLAFPLNGAFFGVSTARSHDLLDASGRVEWLKAWEHKVRKDLPMTVVQSTSFWGPVQAINFTLVPAYARALYVNVAFFTWTSYLSFIAFRKPSE